MDNIFDKLQNNTFDVINRTMGYNAKWVKDGEELTARVLYSHPDEKTTIGDVDWDLESFKMEYKEGDFVGLNEEVNRGGNVMVDISIGGVWHPFQVKKIKTLYDGKTVIAYLSEY